MLEWLKGKRTYLVAIAIGILTALWSAGVVDSKLYEIGMGLLGGTGLASLRAGVSNNGNGA